MITANNTNLLAGATDVYLQASPTGSITYEVYEDPNDAGTFYAYSVTDGFGGSGVEVGQSTSEAWVYQPAAEFSGPQSLTYTIVDDGTPNASVTNTGRLDVIGVDDAPEITVPASIAATEDEAIVIEGLSITDVDYGGEELEVHLTVGDGTLQYENYIVSACLLYTSPSPRD